MDTEIIEFMRTSFSPEMAESYEKSFELFSKFNVEDYILPFNEIYMLVDEFDLTYIQQQFNDQLVVTLNDVLHQHGIFMNDEATIALLNEVLDGILNIENYEDHEMILTILDNEVSDEEKIADIFSLVTQTESETLLTGLDRVNPGMLRTISTLFNGRQMLLQGLSNSEASTIKAKAEWVKRLYSLTSQEFKDCRVTVVYPKLEDGLRLNMGFQFYHDLLWDEISQLTNADIARDLVGISIISCDQSEKVLENIKAFVGTFFHDLDQIGRVIDLATRQFLVSKQDNGIAIIPQG